MQFDQVVLETQEAFIRQTYRNRCRVLTSNKVDVLTVPVKSRGAGDSIRDVRIDYEQDWHRRHWGCLRSAYGKSPFFEHYAPRFEHIYRKKLPFLFDFNFELLTLCLYYLGISTELTYTLSRPSENKSLFDARSIINAKKKPGGSFFYSSYPYQQTFGNEFVPNMSIVDLLFNKGPESRLVLSQSIPTPSSLNEQSLTDIR